MTPDEVDAAIAEVRDWLDDYPEEFDAILSDALNGSRKPTRESAWAAVEAIRSADQAGRDWPQRLEEEALIRWCFNAQKSISKREAVVIVAHDGQIVGKSMRVGRATRRQDGTSGFDQALFSEMTWEEVARWAAMILTQIAGLKGNLSMVNRVMALRVEVPDSAGPGDAATQLGTTVDAWIEAAS